MSLSISSPLHDEWWENIVWEDRESILVSRSMKKLCIYLTNISSNPMWFYSCHGRQLSILRSRQTKIDKPFCDLCGIFWEDEYILSLQYMLEAENTLNTNRRYFSIGWSGTSYMNRFVPILCVFQSWWEISMMRNKVNTVFFKNIFEITIPSLSFMLFRLRFFWIFEYSICCNSSIFYRKFRKKNCTLWVGNPIPQEHYRFNYWVKPGNRKRIKIHSSKAQVYSISELSIAFFTWESLIIDPTMLKKVSRNFKNINLLTTTDTKSILFEWIEPWSSRNISFFKKSVISEYASRECVTYITWSHNRLRQEISKSWKHQTITLIFCENNTRSLIGSSVNNSRECVGTRNVHETLWWMMKYMENREWWKFFRRVKIDLFQNIV